VSHPAHFESGSIHRVLADAVRCRWVVLAGAAVVAAYSAVDRPYNDDWRYFLWGSRLLFGEHPAWAHHPGGFHLFANYPVIQIGPLSLVVARALRIFGDEGARIAAMAAGMLLVVGGMVAIERTSASLRGNSRPTGFAAFSTLLGGVVVIFAWSNLAVSAVHIDDALANALTVGAILAVVRGRPVWTGVVIGLAVASKPWAAIFVPLVFVFDAKGRVRSATATGAVILLAWGPFVLADRGTMSAGAPRVPVSTASVLALFGVEPGSAPSWLRLAQLVVCAGLVALSVVSGRARAALLVGVAGRLVLDPGVFNYYSVGLIAGAYVWETLRRDPRWPVFTVTAFATLLLAAMPLDPSLDRLQALLRLVTCGAALCLPYLESAPDDALDGLGTSTRIGLRGAGAS